MLLISVLYGTILSNKFSSTSPHGIYVDYMYYSIVPAKYCVDHVIFSGSAIVDYL